MVSMNSCVVNTLPQYYYIKINRVFCIILPKGLIKDRICGRHKLSNAISLSIAKNSHETHHPIEKDWQCKQQTMSTSGIILQFPLL